MAFLPALMSELVLESGVGAVIGSVAHKVIDEFKGGVKKVAINEFSNLVGNEIKRNPDGAVSQIVQKNSTGRRSSSHSCACPQPRNTRRKM